MVEFGSTLKKLKLYFLSVLFLSVVCGSVSAQSNIVNDETGLNPIPEVKLLSFPYPFEAAVTVASDTHHTNVELFQGVHVLINTRARIIRDSALWAMLFDDPEIDRREDWENGIQGFGLPIADTFWLYGRNTGVFARFDTETGNPVPHFHNGKDFRQIIDEWFREGWIDALHTPGEGDIRREASARGLEWLTEERHRQSKVWINHSITETPASIEPDVTSALTIVTKNFAKLGTALLSYAGADGLAGSIPIQPFPAPFPPGQKLVVWLLALSLAGSLLWVFVSVARKKRGNAFAATFTLLIVVATLYQLPLAYGQGDNPESPYYNLDLARNAGFRYFWFVGNADGYKSHIENQLGLPESMSILGRPTFLRVVTVDDGSRVIVFPRNYKGRGGLHSLELLTESALERLCEQAGTAILYTHWSEYPRQTFTAKALDGLRKLSNYYEAKRVWVAPSSEILHFHFVRTFLEYDVYMENGKKVIDIIRVNSPAGDPVIPSHDDLRGISFESEADYPIEVRLAGGGIERDLLEVLQLGDRVVVYFRGFTGGPGLPAGPRSKATTLSAGKRSFD